MPVATQASLKGLTPEQLEETSCRLCLNNTYHLGLKPGQAVLDSVGGAHRLQGWKHNILTDSGGLVETSPSYAQHLMDIQISDGLPAKAG
jgi:queuine tRNA-ribosyltransferase catalytic subunit